MNEINEINEFIQIQKLFEKIRNIEKNIMFESLNGNREIELNCAHLYFVINGSSISIEEISTKHLSKQFLVLTCVPKPVFKMFDFIDGNAFIIRAIGFLSAI